MPSEYLHARKDALDYLYEELSIEEYEVAERAVDKYIDCLEEYI